MIVLISGIPMFSHRLARDLRSVDKRNKYYFLDTYNSKWERLKFLLLLPFSKIVISMNGVTDQSGSMDWVLRFRKKLIMQWMGTDVLIAIDRAQKGIINRKYIDYASNFVDAQWLGDELKTIGLNSKMVRFKHGVVRQGKLDAYSEIGIVSYIGNERQEFYGINKVAALAALFPDVAFHLYGLDRAHIILPKNVRCYGWQPESVFQKALSENPICLRLTEHDGFSMTVIEALAYGCEVIWSFPSERTYLAGDIDETATILRRLLNKIEERGMIPNEENRIYIAEHFDKEKVLLNYLQVLNEL